MTGCGFTPDEIDQLTYFDIEVLFKYWNEFPPANELLKHVYGAKPKKHTHAESKDDPSGIGVLIARFPNGFVH